MQSYPIIKDLVLVGGGHAHVQVLKRLGMNPLPGLQVTLISPESSTPYSGMLPGCIAGHYTEDDIHIDLVALCRFAGVRFLMDKAVGLQPDNHQLLCARYPRIKYDVLSLDIGITPQLSNVPGSEHHVIPVKPVNNFLQRWNAFQLRVLQLDNPRIAVVGGGAGGVEICFAIHHRLVTQMGLSGIQLGLFSDGEILRGHNESVRNRVKQTLQGKNIILNEVGKITSVQEGALTSSSGDIYEMDEVFWVTHAASHSWLKECGLSVDASGFVTVKETLQTLSHDNVFAVGDIATVVNHPRPRAGVFAVRQGVPLDRNLRRYLKGESCVPFKPQRRFLSLIAEGERKAVASKGRLYLAGEWIWKWKDWIDRKFMRTFNDLPDMPLDSVTGLLREEDNIPHCGGCGAKVGADILREVLAEVFPEDANGEGRIERFADDAAILEMPADKALVQSTDHFRSFINDPFLFARIALIHAMSDIHAMGSQVDSVQVLVTLPTGRAEKQSELLRLVMEGVKKELGQAKLVGGHTAEGLELSLGFVVNGYLDKRVIWRKSGLKSGDRLILTKALGTGALLAADMQHQAKGRAVREGIDEMLISNAGAAEIARKFSISACTDVTGFGLVGHLVEMLEATNLAASIDIESIPALEGACAAFQRGIFSSLHESNARGHENRLSQTEKARKSAKNPLLFDPQTSGGLLFGIREEESSVFLDALQEAGYRQATCIGLVSPKGLEKEPIRLI